VLVLNEDTLLDPDCLRLMVEAGERDPKIGVVGPLVYHADEPMVIQSAGGRLGPYWQSIHIGQNEPDQGQFKEPQDVEWVSGCAIMVRRQVVADIGMLDERYFYYWEETEWCMRATRAGWKILNVPAARLWHKGVKRDYKPGPSVSYYGTRNRFLTFSKHHAPAPVWARAWYDTTRTLVSWTVKPRWRNQRGHRDAMWRGVIDFLSHRWGKMPS
jgi:GT2 family glycosyltransferase